MKDVILENFQTLDRKSKWVFQNKDGNNLYNNLYKRFKAVLRRTHIDRQSEVGLHTLRHTWVSHLLHNGVPLKRVSTLAGHKNLTTTERYAHLVGDAESLHLDTAKIPDFGS